MTSSMKALPTITEGRGRIGVIRKLTALEEVVQPILSALGAESLPADLERHFDKREKAAAVSWQTLRTRASGWEALLVEAEDEMRNAEIALCRFLHQTLQEQSEAVFASDAFAEKDLLTQARADWHTSRRTILGLVKPLRGLNFPRDLRTTIEKLEVGALRPRIEEAVETLVEAIKTQAARAHSSKKREEADTMRRKRRARAQLEHASQAGGDPGEGDGECACRGRGRCGV
jgi:hypothetical protein